MSICIISDHIIMLRQNFSYNTQHIDQVKPKYEGWGASAPKSPPPLDPPLIGAFLLWQFAKQKLFQNSL